jgi:hypothetical protein
MTGYICNLVLPGAGKSGTSSLHDLLDQHPELNMSRPKEPQHFSFDDLYARGAVAHNALFRSDRPYRYHGESSQCYMFHPAATDRIKACLTAPKIILLLRDPVDRLWSQYQWNYRRAVERASLMQALETRGDDTGYNYNPAIRMYQENGGYLSASRYSKWVPFWRETFGPDNVLVLRTEDLRADPVGTLRTCFAFLDVASFDIQERPRRNETSKMMRVPPLPVARIERHMPRALRWSRPYTALRWQALRALTPTPPDAMSAEEKAYVHEYLRDDIAFHEALAA